MREHDRHRPISGVAALLLLLVFSAAVLAVLLSGAGAYRRLTERDRLAYDSRTCVQYVATKVRQAPGPEAVSLTAFGDGDSLTIAETIEGTEYQTRVYCHDGWLMELFSAADAGLAPEDGEKILRMRTFALDREADLLRVELTDGNGIRETLLLQLRGGEEAEP